MVPIGRYILGLIDSILLRKWLCQCAVYIDIYRLWMCLANSPAVCLVSLANCLASRVSLAVSLVSLVNFVLFLQQFPSCAKCPV